MHVLIDALALIGRGGDEAKSVLGHGAGELGTQHLGLELQRSGVARKVEVQSHLPLSGEHAVDLEQHAVRRDVETAPEDETSVALQRDLDLGDRAKLAA